ncbi:hypothetical protein [Desulfonatronovibrio magnus]|uniref:hypothetical protein n=1 Tax=Desulfonatronovibrio magnus TaxID=698827 RepID=UPI0012FCD13C|nr:hypothetical protein [Desulfonatronovibrio magnus]
MNKKNILTFPPSSLISYNKRQAGRLEGKFSVILPQGILNVEHGLVWFCKTITQTHKVITMHNPLLPFFGLGFDMTPAVLTAGQISLVRVAVENKAHLEMEFSPWGFDLLMHLSRETNGT